MKQNVLFSILLIFFALPMLAQVDDEETMTEEDVDIKVIKEDTWEDADTIDIEDIDVEDIEEDEYARQSNFPWERFAVGGQIGNLSFGDQTSISLAPEVVYTINPTVQIGVDGVYELYKVNRLYTRFGTIDTDYKEKNSGGRMFTRIKPVSTFPVFAQLEFERMNQEKVYTRVQTGNTYSFPSIDQNLNNINGGLGFMNGPYYIGLMYSFMNKQNKEEFRELAAEDANRIGLVNSDGSPITPDNIDDRNYQNAVSFRTGLNIPLGRGDKNKKREKKKKKDRKEFLPN